MSHIKEGAVKVIEIIGISSKSFEDAAKQGIKKASESIKGISGFEITKHLASAEDGEITSYKVVLKVAFTVL
jgi:flavin-binding protein dodecin